MFEGVMRPCFLTLYFCVAIIHQLEWIYLLFTWECSCEQPSLEGSVPTPVWGGENMRCLYGRSQWVLRAFTLKPVESLVREMKEDLAEGRDHAQ